MSDCLLPEWLEEHCLPCAPGCYDAMPDELRARLKTQIALLCSFWGEGAVAQHTVVTRLSAPGPLSGYHNTLGASAVLPKEWAIVAFEESYASAPGLLAALLPVAQAEVAEIIPLRLGGASGKPLADALVAALTMTGHELAYDLNSTQTGHLLSQLNEQSGAGRGSAVFLGDSAACRETAAMALALGASTRLLPGAPHIAVEQGCGVDEAVLRWNQPGANIFPFAFRPGPREGTRGETREGAEALPACDAFVGLSDPGLFMGLLRPASSAPDGACISSSFSSLGAPCLWLKPGREALWVWPELSPLFFSRRLAALL